MTRELLIGRDGGVLDSALARLSGSGSAAHAEYARRQLVLLERL
jgi:hypothetical protein